MAKRSIPQASRTARIRTRKRGNRLDGIFRPRSVAVIGASRRKQTIGHEILSNLMSCEFNGAVYPVNPSASSVHSIKSYARLADIPGPVDLAVVVVPKGRVLPVVRQCGKKGVKGLIVITAGFKEVGAEGAAAEAKLAELVHKHGMRMVGPNCMGVVNTEPDVRLNATFAAAVPIRGNVGFVSQSGALGEAIIADAAQAGLGIAMFVSVGNKGDVSGNDLLEYWEDNPDIGAILMYLESFGNPRRFTSLARRVTRKKPVITVKAGRTAAGARAASSHTGSIVGLDIATDSLLEQCGILRVGSMADMFVQADALANQPVPRGRRIAIVTNAGGPGILCTDACIGRGLEIAVLRPATHRALERVMPAEATSANPIDMIASADAERYRDVLKIIKKDPGVDAIIAIFVSPIMIDAFEVARAIADSATGAKPILSVFMGKRRSEEGLAELRKRRVPVYRFPEEAASAMGAMARYRVLRDAPIGKPVRFRVDRPRARKAISRARSEGRSELLPSEVFDVLGAYGLPVAQTRRSRTAAEAIAAAIELDYPVVLKVASSRISHKTDVQGVKIDLRNADEVGKAFRDLTSRLRKHDPDLEVLVQKMVTGGREVILGMTRDPNFGPLMMFGLGGVYVEVLQDVSVKIHPLTDVDARSMVRRIKGFPLLAGTRGEKAVDVERIEECLLRLSRLVSDFETEIGEMDINPFIVTDRPDTSMVVDARIFLAS
jgi:acetyltransferase